MQFFRQKAFSLIELIITLLIVGILTAIAVPSYTTYIQNTRRSDGKIALMDLANRMDRYFTENNTYAGATLAGVSMNAASPEGYYTLTITNAAATSYTIQAAPTGSQASDTECAAFTYNELGAKGVTGAGTAADCW